MRSQIKGELRKLTTQCPSRYHEYSTGSNLTSEFRDDVDESISHKVQDVPLSSSGPGPLQRELLPTHKKRGKRGAHAQYLESGPGSRTDLAGW